MTLNSFHFVVYFAAFVVVLALLQLVKRKYEVVGKAQLILLLLFSYFFIYKSSWKFCVCSGLHMLRLCGWIVCKEE